MKARLWTRLHSTLVWRQLRRIGLLRSCLYLAIELYRAARESHITSVESVDRDFSAAQDPWNYNTSPLEQKRFATQTQLLDAVASSQSWGAGLEIGCAEGLYTQVLALRCDSLCVLDISPTALARAEHRQNWAGSVKFCAFDLQHDAVQGVYDLIVVTGVLEYFQRSRTLCKIRLKLIAALRPDGYLLVETTRVNPVVENSWWGRRLIRGRWINAFIASHHSMRVIDTVTTDTYCVTLCQKLPL